MQQEKTEPCAAQPTAVDRATQPTAVNCGVQPTASDCNTQTVTTNCAAQPATTDRDAGATAENCNVQPATTDRDTQPKTVKTIVIYKSKTGFAQKYANWISEDLDCASISLKEASIAALRHYDIIIFGAGIYAGKINGIDFVLDNMDVLMEKKLAVFATGAAPGEATDTEKIKKDNFGEYENLPFFYMPAGINYEKMQGKDKMMMSVFKFMLGISGKKEEKAAIAKTFNISDRGNITPLIDFVKENYL